MSPPQVARTVQHILDRALDGVNFDWEAALSPRDAATHAYTQLVALTAAVLNHVAPGTQVLHNCIKLHATIPFSI